MAIRLTVDDNTSAVLTLGANDETTLSADATTVVAIDNYNDLRNKPSINNTELVGNVSLDDLDVYSETEVDTLLSTKADRADIPSLDGYATEQWVENKHYLTEHQSLAEYYTKTQTDSLLDDKADASDIPTKTSQLTNDSGFVNASGASAAAPVQSVNGDTGTVVLDADDVGALPTTEKSVLFYGQVDSTSTATAFTAQIDGITEYFDGLTVMLKNGVVTSASGFTIDINGLGAKHAYSNMTAATAETTIFNVNYTMLFTYDSTRVEGGGWICYRGYNSDNNTIGYQLRTNSMSLPMKSATWRYRLLFTSADGEHFVPANNSNSTNATASRAVCQDAIDPFGDIRYYGTTASVAANSRPSATALWEQYAIALGYSFNRTGAALTLTAWKPVYVKCAPQSDGSAIIDSTTPYVQDLPTTEDGKIYIYLGVAYSATNIELVPHHPVYWYKDGQIRPYTNAVSGGGGLLVTVTEDGEGTYTADKTAGEIKNVLEVGGSVVIKIGYNYEPLTGAEIQSNRYDFYSKSFPHNPLTCNSLDDYPSHYSDN